MIINRTSTITDKIGLLQSQEADLAKTVVFLFHGDDDALGAGSHIAERIRQVADDYGVELEVFCFGPPVEALTPRGLTLEFARDAFVRFGLEGASVISF